MRHILIISLVLVLVALTQIDVQSHHAFSSEFDVNRPISLRGKITKVEWINPHTWLHMDAVLEDGSIQPWMLEGGTPNTLLRAGLTRTLMEIGTDIRVYGYQSKDAECEPKCRGSGRDVTFADGRSIFMGSSGVGAPRDGRDRSETR